MARIAEEAGRDAFRKPAAEATFDTNPALHTIPSSEATLVTATRLYRACLSGATDPSADRLESWKSEPRLHQSSARTPKE